MELHSKSVVVITGASSGIGAALARRLARRGLKLALCARRIEKLEALAAELRENGTECLALRCDVSDERQAQHFVEQVLQHYGRIDVLVNNAGRGNMASVEDTTSSTLHSIFSLNVFALWFLSAPTIRHMKERGSGRVICVASVAGKFGFPFNSAYVAAKHAVVGFVASLRAELAGSGISASVVCPDGVETEWQGASEDGNIGELFWKGIQKSRRIAVERHLERAPLKRMISADVAAECIERSIVEEWTDDVYTHDGSREQAMQCAHSRHDYDTSMLPLFLGMQEAYDELAHRGTDPSHEQLA